jgi:hypothetical protein
VEAVALGGAVVVLGFGLQAINFIFDITNGCPKGFMSTNVQSFKCTKSKVPLPEAKAVKSLKGIVTNCFPPVVL